MVPAPRSGLGSIIWQYPLLSLSRRYNSQVVTDEGVAATQAVRPRHRKAPLTRRQCIAFITEPGRAADGMEKRAHESEYQNVLRALRNKYHWVSMTGVAVEWSYDQICIGEQSGTWKRRLVWDNTSKTDDSSSRRGARTARTRKRGE